MKPIPPKKEAADGSWVDEEDFDLSGLFLDSEPPARPAPDAPPPTEPPAREPAPPADSGNADFEVVELAELLEDDTHVRPTPIPEGSDDEPIAASGDLTAPPPAPVSTMPPPEVLGTSTMRPPRPESEYVADMMGRARSPWPPREAQGATIETAPPAAATDVVSEERFDFGDLDDPPAKSGAATLPPPSDLSAADADEELDRPTRPVDLPPAPGSPAAERLRSRSLDSELDTARGSRAAAENTYSPHKSEPSTRRGIGDSSSSRRSGQATQPRPSASEGVGRIASTAPPPAGPPAAPRPRPPSAGGVRFAAVAQPGSRRPPSLDAPFATVSSAKLAAAVSAPSPTPPTARDALTRIRDRFDLGDYSGALVQAEAILEDRPQDPDARRLAEACRTHLRQMYLSHIGERSRVPRVVMEPDQLRWLSLDHRSGFLLSVIDGMSCIDEIIDVSGMPELDTLRILYDFVLQGVIQVEPLRGGRR